jgi:hypothetical protein
MLMVRNYLSKLNLEDGCHQKLGMNNQRSWWGGVAEGPCGGRSQIKEVGSYDF